MKQIIAVIRVENMIDLITNSSSELFVINAKNTTAKVLTEMVNSALGYTFVTENSFEPRFKKESANYEMEWEIDNILENFPEEDREELRKKYFANGGNYFAITQDRDDSYRNDYKVKDTLIELGFEFMGSDY